MAALNISASELEQLIKRAIISTLTERSDLLENAVAEAILDMKLGLAIEEGDTGEYVDEKQISSLLRDWSLKVLYAKALLKDLDAVSSNPGVKKRLSQLIETLKIIKTLNELQHVKKIEGFDCYYRLRIGDYRLGLKVLGDTVELIRFLHRRDIYRRFPWRASHPGVLKNWTINLSRLNAPCSPPPISHLQSSLFFPAPHAVPLCFFSL
jgi:mRNA interferase RelE/StbE